MIDHRGDQAAEAEVKPHLHHDQNDRQDNADKRGNEAKPILKQILKGSGMTGALRALTEN